MVTATKFYLDAAGLDPLEGHAALSTGLLANLWFVIPVTVVVGAIIGAWAGALGLGGGLLAVPALVLLFGVELHVAEGTSLLMFLPNSIAGGYMHLHKGTASPRLGRLLNIGAIPGAIAGALLALALNSAALGAIFGTFALAMGTRELVKMVRPPRPVPDDVASSDDAAAPKR